jgi:protein-arginine kinase activator protein McsA
VRAHSELAWILNCVARLGWLDRMTQFKEKSGKHKERSSVGLYTYPVLQAADILLYKATEVPTGEDQKQHLELTRDIAAKFNNDFNAPGFFPLPEPLTQGPAPRVMSLRDGAAKMSKSDPSDQSRINLTDDADTIVAKIRKARTDPDALPETLEGLEGRAEAKNLVTIYAALADISREAVLAQFAGQIPAVQVSARREPIAAARCPGCGLPFADFRQTGLLGCPACYDAFMPQIGAMIERAQAGAVHHVGRSPQRLEGMADRVALRKRLMQELETAIAAEQYERAARLRDQLQGLGDVGGKA